MSIEILPLVLLMFFHFVGDFILQKPSWAKNKSNSSKELFKHVSMYTLVFIIPCLIFSFNLIQIVSFLLITFQLHFIIDEYTSKITSNQFKELNNQKDEGFVIRVTDSFKYIDFSKSLCKLVRANHVTSNAHWRFKKVIPNKLKEG